MWTVRHFDASGQKSVIRFTNRTEAIREAKRHRGTGVSIISSTNGAWGQRIWNRRNIQWDSQTQEQPKGAV